MNGHPRLTRRGGVTLVAGAVTFVLARGFGTPALATMGVGLLIVVLGAYAATALAAQGLAGSRTLRPDHPRAGDTVEIVARVAAPAHWRWLVRLLEWRVDPGGQTFGRGTLTRTPDGLRMVVDRARRGEHRLAPLRIGIGDTFGLTRAHRAADRSRTVVIPPRTVPSAATTSGLTGRRPGRSAVLGEDISSLESLREYVPGDPLSRVHWGQSAKRGRLHTKVFRPDDGGGRIGTVLLDCALDSQRDEEAFEVAVMAAASVMRAVDARRGGAASANLWLSGESTARPAAWAEAERRLAAVQRRGEVAPIARILAGVTRTLSPGYSLVVVTADADSEVIDMTSLARRSGIDVVLIRVGAPDDGLGAGAVVSVADEASLAQALVPGPGRGSLAHA